MDAASSISMILSEVTRVAHINGGVEITTTTHEQTGTRISSHQTYYTIYDKSANIEEDHTPRYIDVRV